MGFFKPKNPTPTQTPPDLGKVTDGADDASSPIPPENAALPQLRQTGPISPHFISKKSVVEDIEEWETDSPGAESSSKEKVQDPVATKESWSKLLGKRVPPPVCEHNEPCISLLTKKPGVNCGKSCVPSSTGHVLGL
jgi:AP endonuclease-2